jgi:hypothetical protein
MIGLEITGRTYNPITYEISNEIKQAKIIDVGLSSIKIWPNGTGNPSILTVDVAYCSPFDGVEYTTNSTIIIPIYLLTSVISAEVDTTKYSLVSGKNTKMYTQSGEDFTEDDIISTGGLVVRSVCPLGFFDSSGVTYSQGNFLICYPLIDPSTFDENSLIFIQEIKSDLISPTYDGGESEETSIETPPIEEASGGEEALF